MAIVYFCGMGRNALAKKRKENPKKRLEIVQGLIAFLSGRSIATASMDDIAKGLDKSKATLYKYYATKEQMIEAVIDFKVSEIAKFVVILQDDEIPFFERYEKSFLLLQKNIQGISNAFIKDLKELFPEIYRKIETLINIAVHELAKYYQLGMDNGVFNQLNANLISYNDFVFFRTLTDPDYLEQNNLSLEKAFNDFYAIRCQGLLTNK